jgi:hypothetical protein
MSVIVGPRGGGQTAIERPGGRESDYLLPKLNTRDRIVARIVAGLFWLLLVPAVYGQWVTPVYLVYGMTWFFRSVVAERLVGDGRIVWLWRRINPLHYGDDVDPRMIRMARALGGGLVFLAVVLIRYGVLSRWWLPVYWQWDGVVGRGLLSLGHGTKTMNLSYGTFVLWLRLGLPPLLFVAALYPMRDLDKRQRTEVLVPGLSGIVFGRADPGLARDMLGVPVRAEKDKPRVKTPGITISKAKRPQPAPMVVRGARGDPVMAVGGQSTGYREQFEHLPWDELTASNDAPEDPVWRLLDLARECTQDPGRFSGNYWTRVHAGRGSFTDSTWGAFRDWMLDRGYATKPNRTTLELTDDGLDFLHDVQARRVKILEAVKHLI